MTQHWNPFGGNSYLAIAAEALRRERRPLTPAEMLEVALRDGFMPKHLFGGTMHKTLSARLSENIRSESGSSPFFRTAPATFFLHELAQDPSLPEKYKKVFVGNLRSKNIRKENVLVASKDKLEQSIFGSFVSQHQVEFDVIYKTLCRFMDRATAEEDSTVKQFVTFTLVYHGSKILIHRRGKFTTTSERLRGQLSVGFGGHVNDADFDLFNRGEDAFRANAARELREELFLDDVYHDRNDAMRRASLIGYVNVDDSPDAEHHIAVLIAFCHATSRIPRKGELSINQLSWLDLETPLNDLSEFDLWSGMILQNIYEGKIRLSA